MKAKFEISILLTWSKIIAVLILLLSFLLELTNEGKGLIFEIALPIVAGMIVGKQWFDRGIKSKDNL